MHVSLSTNNYQKICIESQTYTSDVMASLKRKYSDQEIRLFSSTSLLNSEVDNSSFVRQSEKQPLITSRTRKRHRNSRPSDSEVYEHTLSLLFSVQRNPQPDHISRESQKPAVPSHQPLNNTSNQSTLPSFWMPQATYNSSSPNLTRRSFLNTPITSDSKITSFFYTNNCEDCGIALNGDTVDLDLEKEDHLCTGCGKTVCPCCSICYIGMERKCLNCVNADTSTLKISAKGNWRVK